jgi:putative ABC transport system permease protein
MYLQLWRYIRQDLAYRGIVADGIQDELLDHVCSLVEVEMGNGLRFIEAYQKVIVKFGHDEGLHSVQKQVLQYDNQPSRNMLRNNLLIAFRNLRKHSFYSAINVIGLSTGIAACLIIVLYIIDELKYDRHFSYADRIYRVEADINFGGNEFRMAYRCAPEAHTLVDIYPEVESAVRFRTSGSYLVRPTDEKDNLKERHVIWTDSTFFDIFSVDIIEGNAEKALTEPESIAISKSIADKYFPGQSALGKSMTLDNKYEARVTAVYRDLPSASHFHFDILIGMAGNWPICKEARSSSYLGENFQTYLLLKPGADPKVLEKKFPMYLEKYMGPEIATAFGQKDFSIEKFQAAGNKYQMHLRPLTDIHLHSDVRGELEPNSNIVYIYLFSTIAAFILVIACINFMNLSTARSSNRAKEVGIRKVMGSMRYQLIRQFMTESVLVTITSMIMAIVLAYLLLPLFNSLTLKNLAIPFDAPLFYVTLTVAALVIAVLSGFYPSLFLSAFKPVNVLKGHFASGMKSGYIRGALVVFQFVITIFLIIGAVTVNRQLNYIQTKNLGFEKDQVIIVHDAYALRPNGIESFKKEVLKSSNLIESGSISGHLPVENEDSYRNHGVFWKEGTTPTTENMISFQHWGVDADYIKTFGMKMKYGRSFSEEFP